MVGFSFVVCVYVAAYGSVDDIVVVDDWLMLMLLLSWWMLMELGLSPSDCSICRLHLDYYMLVLLS